MKYPWMQFYVNDWLTPNVGLCRPETRGIWIEWICQMHLLDRCGQITGTLEQLAFLGRCTSVQVESTLKDLIQTKTADVMVRSVNGHGKSEVSPKALHVTVGNEIVTVINRRMKREHLARVNGAVRVKRYRNNVACNAPVTAHNHKSYIRGEGESASEPPRPPDQPTPKTAPPFEKKEGWQLRKDLKETTDPAERAAIQAELKRRAGQTGQKPLKATPPPPLPGREQDEATLKRLAEQVAKHRKELMR